MSILVFGHKNPDTDAIVSALTLTHLKQALGVDAKACALGELRKEAQFVLNYFGVDAPEVIKDVKPQVKDIAYEKIEGVRPELPLLRAYQLLDAEGKLSLPVIDANGRFVGIASMKDVVRGLLNGDPRRIHTSVANILSILGGQVLVDTCQELNGRVLTISQQLETLKELIQQDDILVVGDRYDVIAYALEAHKLQAIIITGGRPLPAELAERAKAEGVTVLSVSGDTYETTLMLQRCNYLSDVVNRQELLVFNENDSVEEAKEVMLNTTFRTYPVVNDKHELLGYITRQHLLKAKGKKVIMVDHNEYGQSADGLQQAEILEIVDHHKLGGITTPNPISFRNQVVGCTCTIIYQMYRENGVDIPHEMAGLLASGIISDTLLLRSPTTTALDRRVLEELNEILKLDMEQYAMQMFKEGTSLEGYSIEEIVHMDFKEFTMEGKHVAIGQVFTLDVDSVFNKKDDFLSYLNNTEYDMLVLAITDILKEGSYLLYKGPDAVIAESFGVEGKQGTWVAGCVSRKKQLVPNLTKGIAAAF